MLNLFDNLTEVVRDESKKDSRSRKKVTLLGRLPRWFPKTKLDTTDRPELERYIKRANRFLEIQESRIVKLIQAKEYEKATWLWFILLKNSRTYQIVLMNRVVPSWYYQFKQEEVLKFLSEIQRKCRKWDWTLTLQRFYIEKKNGKLRPIGAPTLVSRIMSKAFTDMVYFIFESGFRDFQHGYRLNKGCYTALYEVWEMFNIHGWKEAYEFDFKSFFNNIPIDGVFDSLKRRSDLLAETFWQIMKKIHYRYEELHEEAEIHIHEDIEEEILDSKTKELKKVKRKLITRTGLPQGLSMSPLLATLAIEKNIPPRTLIMYADDGLIFGEEFARRHFFLSLAAQGINIEPTKTKKIENTFTFLGTTWDLSERTVKWENAILKWTEEEAKTELCQQRVKDWFQKVANLYGKKPDTWEWDIADRSFAMIHKERKVGLDYVVTYLKGLLWATQYKGYRYFIGKGIFSISGLSSMCCGSLLKTLRELKSKASHRGRTLIKINRKNVDIDTSDKFRFEMMNKVKYFEGTRIYKSLFNRPEDFPRHRLDWKIVEAKRLENQKKYRGNSPTIFKKFRKNKIPIRISLDKQIDKFILKSKQYQSA